MINIEKENILTLKVPNNFKKSKNDFQEHKFYFEHIFDGQSNQ